VARSRVPILVIDLDERPARGLNDLQASLEVNASAISLMIDPVGRTEVAQLGRELGATLVLSGVVVPPDVEALIQHWLPIAGHREETGGWWPTSHPEPEPWERADLFLSSDQHHGP
jgi:hypothetical protein